MSAGLVRARVLERLGRLRLGRIAEQLDALLSSAARGEPGLAGPDRQRGAGSRLRQRGSP